MVRSLGIRSFAVAVVAAVMVPAAAAAAVAPPGDQPSCAPPTAPRQQFEARTPEALGFDRAKLQAALRFAAKQAPVGVTAIYRHGCLAGQLATNSSLWRKYQGWSMSKSITALSAASAVMHGQLSWDDPVGSLEPRAGAAKGAITIENLADQTGGFRHNVLTDFGIAGPYGNLLNGWFFKDDVVRTLLGEPLTHAPGTWWEYQQPPVALAASVIGTAVGTDLRSYASENLMAPLGIPADQWGWDRDGTGRPLGFMGVRMAVPYWARFGQMLLQGGTYAGSRIVPSSFVDSLHRGTEQNPFYRRYFWNNAADHGLLPTGLGRTRLTHPLAPAAPRDMFMMQGAFGQEVMVIPSLDMVMVRTQDFGGDPLGQGSVQSVVGVLAAIQDGTTGALPTGPAVHLPTNAIPDQHYPLPELLETITQTKPGPLPTAVPLRPRALSLQSATSVAGGLQVTVACPAVNQNGACRGVVAAAGVSVPYAAAPGTQAPVLLGGAAVQPGTAVTVTATNDAGSTSTPSTQVLVAEGAG
jgi:CubicO group peptidase (beta-lactamase class C family)